MGSIRQGFRALLGILGADKEERDEFRGAYYFLSIIFFVLIGRDNYLRQGTIFVHMINQDMLNLQDVSYLLWFQHQIRSLGSPYGEHQGCLRELPSTVEGDMQGHRSLAHSESPMTCLMMSCWPQWTLAFLKEPPPSTQPRLHRNAVGGLETFDYILKEYLSKLQNGNTPKQCALFISFPLIPERRNMLRRLP